MRTRPSIIKNQNGFTLVELIVTIMVAAILGVMFVQIMGTSLTGTVEPLIRTQHMFEINGVMENITRDSDTTPLDTLKTQILAGTYGSYTVKDNRYVVFEYSAEDNVYKEKDDDTGGNRVLKVTIADENNEQRLTALFTK